MKRIIATLAVATLFATAPSAAQRRGAELSVADQRAAAAAWSQCIADEFEPEAARLLVMDFTSTSYKVGMRQLAKTRVSQGCFDSIDRDYRRLRLSGLPFAGGLAERLLEKEDAPLLERLAMAAIGAEAPTFSITDKMAMCTVRGAPNLVADLFATEIESAAEQAAYEALLPVTQICWTGDAALSISPFGLRSMLATASYRLLAAQDNEGRDDA
ncbi:hypothetical protein [Sphingomicrobium astaxanthinifaciens]|uniref:hypothetical protein n=1 Tax=Sphingomicrobium astaxanthinifaciens TaxID=1227949 RepID=UPI001FCBF9D3|nr:hypothetical protein [Sphingomicrobium astaxanthinifaciens]MCJ7422154.1 hypothetical protein [Sphingomicrobium astaxanthinifaciens]